MRPKTQLILALDVDSIKKAKYFINKLYPKIKIFKVGSGIFTLGGPQIVEFIRKKGAEVFLDLKFFDIPNTVASAVRQAVRLKLKMLTLHILGGPDMLQAAVQATKEEARRLKLKRPLLIGVTILTSQEVDSKDVFALAKIALDCGLDGVVCSARETALLRRRIKKEFLVVTPGIRPKRAKADDQRRTATVSQAIEAGSDFIVIGRPILQAKDPLKALEEMV